MKGSAVKCCSEGGVTAIPVQRGSSPYLERKLVHPELQLMSVFDHRCREGSGNG